MPGKILVVDDVATNRIILKAKLGIACYDVIQAADGASALAKAARDRPDLILLDLAMPEMSGLDVLASLKADQQTASIPVVIVSAQVDRRSRLAALAAGAEDFLAKPVDDMLLTARVRSLLRARLLADELDLRDGTRRALGFSETRAPFAAPPIVGPGALRNSTQGGAFSGSARGHGAEAMSAPPGTPPAAARQADAFDKGRAPVPPSPLNGGAANGRSAETGTERGHIALIGLGSGGAAWLDPVMEKLPHEVTRLSRAGAMRLARAAAQAPRAEQSPAAPPTKAPPPGQPPLSLGASIRPAQPPFGRLDTEVADTSAESGVPEAIVILSDAGQEHDALMLLSELRAGPGTCHTAILVAAPADQRAQTAIALDLGASDVLPLPLSPEEAALRLDRQIARCRRDRDARRQLRDGLQLAVTDALTGLPNRRYGLSHLERALERALERDTPLSVLMLDLDRFKAVNDLHGHAAGDAVLRSVAARLEPQLRAGDVLARIGGEEFLVILPDAPAEDAAHAAERLRRAVDAIPVALPAAAQIPAPHAHPTVPLEVHQTVSVGLACGPAGAERDLARRAGLPAAAAALLERADAALLRAKSSGRNCVVQNEARGKGEAAA